MEKLMLIDGNSILNRAFFGVSGGKILATTTGIYTNAVFGFINIMTKYIEEEKPQHICVAFDVKALTFRHKEYNLYKAQRKKMPEELAQQVPLIKEVLDAMNISRIELEGYEADDLIGTLSKLAEQSGIEAVIVTGDRDSFQLISESVRVKLPRTKGGKTETEEYTLDKISQEYAISPKQFIDLKGLMGDSSDNIPGVPGVGEKTALKLIQEYQNLEGVYNNLNSVKGALKQKLEDGKESAFMSRKLATINCSVPTQVNVSDLQTKPIHAKNLYEVFKKLEFKSLLQKFNLNLTQDKDTPPQKLDFHIPIEVNDETECETILSILRDQKELSIAFISNDNETVIQQILLYMKESAFFFKEANQFTKILRELIRYSSQGLQVYGHNVKLFYIWMHSLGLREKLFSFDTMLSGYVLQPTSGNFSLSQLVMEYCNLSIPEYSEILKEAKKTKQNVKEIATSLLPERAAAILHLAPIMQKKLQETEQTALYDKIELPLLQTLADMEYFGFSVNADELKRISLDLDTKIRDVTREIYELAEEEFNINSPKQLGVILFEKLGLKAFKKTKTGYSTDAEVLDALSDQHPIISKLIEFRQYGKLKSTYADGLLPLIHEKTGKIHSRFQQMVTATGRISSTEPNLQNIPIKLALGREIRKAFRAESDEYVLVDADYSQIELRVLAHVTADENMVRAFQTGEDIHTMTACKVFNISPEEVTPLQRSRAKAVNFGIVYGIGDFSLAKDLGITRKEARAYIDGYLDQYPGVRNYMHTVIEEAKTQGFVKTLFNRRRELPELQSKNFTVRSFGERVALNMPIQGTAADIIKIAMVRVRERLLERNFKSRLILQVHDELIIETHRSELEQIKTILKESMEQAVSLHIPLTIDLHVGETWYDTK